MNLKEKLQNSKKFIAPAASGILLTLSQPLPWDINLGFLAWVAIVPFAASLRNRTPGERFAMGIVAGTVHYITAVYWLVFTFNTYGNLNIPGSIFGALLAVGMETAYVTLFAIFMGKALDMAPKAPMACLLPFVYTAAEWLRGSTPFRGFPWLIFGYSQGKYPIVAQCADLGGVWMMTFLLALVNGAIIDAVEWKTLPDRKFPRYPIIAAAAFFILNLGYGAWRISDVTARNEAGKPLRVAALQGNIRQDMKWDENSEQYIISTYVDLQKDAMQKGAQLIVWPEAAIPFAFERDVNGIMMAKRLAESGVYTLLGSIDYTTENGLYKYSNSSYLIGPRGIEGKYSKMHLVPFGEYLPYVKYLSFVDKIVKGATGNFNAGEKLEVFQLPQGTISVIICYEAIFGGEVRRFRNAGAELLVNITNDAWFGDTSAPKQHLAMAAFRSIENHVWLIRAANTGISAAVDPLGRIVTQTQVFTETSLIAEVKLIPGGTPYSKFGDVFLYAVLIACVAGYVYFKLKNKKANS